MAFTKIIAKSVIAKLVKTLNKESKGLKKGEAKKRSEIYKTYFSN